MDTFKKETGGQPTFFLSSTFPSLFRRRTSGLSVNVNAYFPSVFLVLNVPRYLDAAVWHFACVNDEPVLSHVGLVQIQVDGGQWQG